MLFDLLFSVATSRRQPFTLDFRRIRSQVHRVGWQRGLPHACAAVFRSGALFLLRCLIRWLLCPVFGVLPSLLLAGSFGVRDCAALAVHWN